MLHGACRRLRFLVESRGRHLLETYGLLRQPPRSKDEDEDPKDQERPDGADSGAWCEDCRAVRPLVSIGRAINGRPRYEWRPALCVVSAAAEPDG